MLMALSGDENLRTLQIYAKPDAEALAADDPGVTKALTCVNARSCTRWKLPYQQADPG